VACHGRDATVPATTSKKKGTTPPLGGCLPKLGAHLVLEGFPLGLSSSPAWSFHAPSFLLHWAFAVVTDRFQVRILTGEPPRHNPVAQR
jgi:hypothetical protein